MLSACQLMVIVLGTDVMTSIGCLFIFYYFISIYYILFSLFLGNSCMHSCYSAEVVICLFLVLGWNTELCPKYVAGCTFQYFYSE